MKVKVTCSKCGESASIPSAKVVRRFRCGKCSHEFVPAVEGVPCPTCGAVVILPHGEPKRLITCMECSFVFRKPRWWLSRRYIILAAIAAVVLLIGISMLLRWRSNMALARELRAEFEAWLATLPQVPDSENGMPLVVKGTNGFEGSFPKALRKENLDFNDEATVQLLGDYLASREKDLALIYEGLGYEKFLFGTDWRKGYAAEIPSLIAFTNAANTLVFKGQLAEYEGRKSEALREYMNAVRLGRTLANERVLITAMIEVAILQISLKPLMGTLSKGGVAEEDLEYALKELHARGGKLSQALETEHYIFIDLIAKLIEGEIDFAGLGKKGIFNRLYYSKFIYNYRADAEISRKAREIYRKADPAGYWKMRSKAKDTESFHEAIGLSSREHSLAYVCIPSVLKSGDVVTETEMSWRGAIALAAVRLFEARNGRLPKNLAELGDLVPKDLLTDPFSGENLIYRPAGDDFHLYSVGYDGVDDKAVGSTPFFKHEGDWREGPDIIFHAPASAAQKK